jgi:hypothetical protein
MIREAAERTGEAVGDIGVGHSHRRNSECCRRCQRSQSEPGLTRRLKAVVDSIWTCPVR